ncbi:MAG: indole-3-glycerol phosphate synthase TrpC [Bacillota bacterium]|nr:indole-3-glycerol phosphate synthase TrpC [Bacillota bacterium]
MQDFLENILKVKKDEVEELKKTFKFLKDERKCISLIEKLKSSKNIGIIAEIKKGSPSKGLFNADLDIVGQAKLYEKFGASAISVLTDSKFFYGSFDYLKEVRKAVSLPLLCKDFIIDEIQIEKAKSSGADLILLIVAALNDDKLTSLYSYAKKLGLEVLVETHNEDELNRALNLDAKLIGINNRNLKTFKVDLNTTIELADKINNGALIIGESGIKTNYDVKKLRTSGVDGILVGETFVTSTNLSESFNELLIEK